MVEEHPGQPEALVEVFGQRFDAHRLCGVMTGVEDVQAELLDIEVRVGGSLTRNIGVQSRCCSLADQAPRASSHDANAPLACRAERHQARTSPAPPVDS